MNIDRRRCLIIQGGILCLSCTVLAALLAPPAEAVSYLKVDDKVILKDGTEVVGTIVFRAKTLLVIMVEGEEKHIKGDDVLKVEPSKVITGMVEKKKGEEPERAPAEPKKKGEPTEKEEPPPEPGKKPEPAKKPKPPVPEPEIIL